MKGVVIFIAITAFAIGMPVVVEAADKVKVKPVVSSEAASVQTPVSAVPQEVAFNPRTDCIIPYRTVQFAAPCIAEQSRTTALWSFILSLVASAMTVSIAILSFFNSNNARKISARALEANRAWLLPEKISATFRSIDLRYDGPDNLFDLEVVFKNFGKSPALNLDVKTSYCLMPKGAEFPGDFDLGGPVVEIGALAPDKSEKISIQISGDDGAAIHTEKKTGFALLDINYTDAFSQGKARRYRAVYILATYDDDDGDDYGNPEGWFSAYGRQVGIAQIE